MEERKLQGRRKREKGKMRAIVVFIAFNNMVSLGYSYDFSIRVYLISQETRTTQSVIYFIYTASVRSECCAQQQT